MHNLMNKFVVSDTQSIFLNSCKHVNHKHGILNYNFKHNNEV